MDGPSLPPSPNSSEFAIEGVGNKTGPLDYLEHPVPLLGGEISKQDSYVSKGGPLSGLGVLVAVRPVAEHRGWKRIRSMEYLGYGRGYLLVRG